MASVSSSPETPGELLALVDRLSAIASGFATVRDLASLADQVSAALNSMGHVEYTGLYLWDFDDDRLRLYCAQGLTLEELTEAERTAWDRHPGWVFRSQQSLHVPDTWADAENRSQSSRRSFVVRSRLYMPVTFLGQSVGVFGIASTTPNAFSDQSISILRFMCRLTGVLYGQLLDRIAREKTMQQLRELNDELASARDEAVTATRAKSDFLATMSHELRTPLNAIIGYGELAVDELDLPEPRTRGDLGRILESATDLLRLINDILDLAKIEAGRMTLCVEAVDVEAVIREVKATLAPQVEGSGNRVETACSLPPGLAWTDGAALKRVLLNLVGNANKFTENGEISVTVWVEGEGTSRMLHVSVQDNGVGMSPLQLSRIFDAFTQADTSTSRKYGGTGLGLTITRELLDLMGGGISATSELGRGSCFHVWFSVDRRYSG